MIKKTEGIQRPLQSTTTDWREHWYKSVLSNKTNRPDYKEAKQGDLSTPCLDKESAIPLAKFKT